ncbi:hypothetical protein ACFYO0_25740 [Streptomyces sp. NPDC006365]|uniref:hypothetical protein n=1 Tax=Streptomyces sp. NPDC006365 TaxID=3364744 RepID=UPI003695C68D
MLDDIPHAQAAAFLGIPYHRGLVNGAAITAWLRRTDKAPEYFQALSRIADRLTASLRVDYHLRRNRLRDWAIPEADWIRIVAEVTRQQRPQHRKLTTWPTVTTAAGTIYVWSQVTRSERVLHPRLPSGIRPATDKPPSPVRIARIISNPGALRSPSPKFENLKSVLDSYCTDVIAKLEA